MGLNYKDYPIVMLSSKSVDNDNKALYDIIGRSKNYLIYGHINDDLHNTYGATRKLLYILDPSAKITIGDWYYCKDLKTSDDAVHQCDTDRLLMLCTEYQNNVIKIIATNDKNLNLPLISGSDQTIYAYKYMNKNVDVVSLFLEDEKIIVKENGYIDIKVFYKKNAELEDLIYQAIGLSKDLETGVINQAIATKKVMEIINK